MPASVSREQTGVRRWEGKEKIARKTDCYAVKCVRSRAYAAAAAAAGRLNPDLQLADPDICSVAGAAGGERAKGGGSALTMMSGGSEAPDLSDLFIPDVPSLVSPTGRLGLLLSDPKGCLYQRPSHGCPSEVA